VLVLVGAPPHGGESILLTKRSLTVESHKGQVSFPGGFPEAEDRDLRDTALREAREEVGVTRDDIEVLGALPAVTTRGSVWIHPWIGLLDFPYPFRPNPEEVERLLLLPVARLIGEGLRQVEVASEGRVFRGPGIDVDGELVWGATARVLLSLREMLGADFGR